jgi:hypothetical protein
MTYNTNAPRLVIAEKRITVTNAEALSLNQKANLIIEE